MPAYANRLVVPAPCCGTTQCLSQEQATVSMNKLWKQTRAHLLRLCGHTCIAGMSRLSFSSACSQVVEGRGKDKCQRQHATVIATSYHGHTAQCVFVNDCMWAFVRACTHSCIVSVLYVDVCVWMSACIILPIWHFRPTAARYRVWLISCAELAVEGGVLKGPDCEESSRLSSCCTLPLLHFPHTQLQWCVFWLVGFSLWLWGGASVCTCVMLNEGTDMQGTPLHQNKPSFFSPYTQWGSWQVVSPWAVQVINPRCCECVCV